MPDRLPDLGALSAAVCHDRVVRVVACAALVVLMAACAPSDPTGEASSGPAARPPPEEPSAYNIVIAADVRDFAHAAHIDLEAIVEEAADAAFASIGHTEQITVDLSDDPERVIAEIGVGGFTHDVSGYVSIYVDTGAVGERIETIRRWLPLAVVHELHHSSRIRTGPGYGSTLAEALVSEGLADAFAAELLPSIPAAPWTAALTRDEMRSLWPTVQTELESASYNHGRWFLGRGDLPRWTGYAFGFDAVQTYLRADDTRTASPSVEASTVLDRYKP